MCTTYKQGKYPVSADFKEPPFKNKDFANFSSPSRIVEVALYHWLVRSEAQAARRGTYFARLDKVQDIGTTLR